MKIKSLYIPDFLILDKFKIDFNVNNNLSVLIGDNGSGKSTILEVIAYIFGHLHKYFILDDKTAEFIDEYEIVFISILNNTEYEIYLKSVYVNQKTNTFKPIIKINGVEKSISQIDKEYAGFKSFLPSRIGLYYAGEAEYLKKLSEHFENKFIKEITREGNPYSLSPLNLPLERPFYYVKKEYLEIILISLLINIDSDSNIKSLFKELLGSEEINNSEISIKIKKPDWANNRNDKLWGINSKLIEQFIEKINQKASYLKDDDDTIMYTFYGIIDLKSLFNDFSINKDFSFIILDTLLYNGILDSIKIKIKIDDKYIECNRLSEGQRQFLVTSGLSILWSNKTNKLLLFDEPDVFLHPKWQKKYIPFIKKNLNDSFAILTTHNPSIISDVNKEQVFLIRNGKVVKKTFKTYGQNFDKLLIDYFGLNSTRNIETTELLKNLYDLIESNKFKDKEFEVLFSRFKKIVDINDTDLVLLNLELKRANEKN